MSEKTMLKFVSEPQAYPSKRAAETRRQDFHEIAAGYAAAEAQAQSARCSQCGVPYCSVHCPLHNHIPDWLRLAAEDRLEEAFALSNATSNMPEICGRICPQDRLCEGSCVIETAGHGAVTIGAVEKYITDTAWEQGWVTPLRPLADRSTQSVGIIGAGPAGLSAAEQLRLHGYEVHVYDRYDRAGGLLTYGIPSFKLEKHVVMRRIARLAEGGIHFHQNFEVGRDASLAQLQKKHDALLIATGVYKARSLEGSASDAAIAALDFLTASNRIGFGDSVPAFAEGALNAAGKKVVVVGGGDTAMDCVRTAVRQGAKSVTCLYRRDRANMPGSQREVAHAEEEGVRFEWLAAPVSLARKGKAIMIEVARMRLGARDASGRRAVVADADTQFSLQADMVIGALGFEPENLPQMFGESALGVTRWGTLRVDAQSMMTNIDGVFAAGDIVRGASLVVWAIRDGRDVAEAMHQHLLAKALQNSAQPKRLARAG